MIDILAANEMGGLGAAWDFLQKGGIFMIPLGLTSVAGTMAILYKALALSGNRVIPQSLAREMAMSSRTLQRRLAAEGVSYQELLEDARKEAAGRYMSESTLAICEIAYLVGYSEPAPFHRAFKRWYGMTPEAFRQKRRT